ncbi:2177_t:CDS:2, partial [Cetraspora pellucida]
MADQLYRNMLRKHSSRENELPEQREKRWVSDHENKVKKRASESAEQRELRLARENEQKHKRRAMKNLNLEAADNHLNDQENIMEEQRIFSLSFENELHSGSERERNTIRKRKSRENETPEQSERLRACDRESKKKKRAIKTGEQCKERLTKKKEKRKVSAINKRLSLESSVERSNHQENNGIEQQ